MHYKECDMVYRLEEIEGQVNSRDFQKWEQKTEACRNFLVLIAASFAGIVMRGSHFTIW